MPVNNGVPAGAMRTHGSFPVAFSGKYTQTCMGTCFREIVFRCNSMPGPILSARPRGGKPPLLSGATPNPGMGQSISKLTGGTVADMADPTRRTDSGPSLFGSLSCLTSPFFQVVPLKV